MKARLVILDMIGTTIRAGEEVPDTFRAVLESDGIVVSDHDLQEVRGRSKREAIARLLQMAEDQPPESRRVDELYHRFKSELRQAYRSKAEEIPGAGDALRRLAERAEVVLTTGLDRVTARQLMEVLGWEALDLGGMITGDDVAKGRPAPDLIWAAMDWVGTKDPRGVVVVGDTVSDLEAAANAGVGWSVGVLSGAHTRAQLEACPHSAILGSVVEVHAWLQEAGALP